MTRDRDYLLNAYAATSTGDDNGGIESYETWLERQLLSRIEKLENPEKRHILNIHIENDTRNQSPTLVYTDANGVEWVHEEQSSDHGGYIAVLVKKQESWYFKPEKNHGQ